MIIFDLDDVLADCEYRPHFVDRRYVPHTIINGSEFRRYPKWYDEETDSCIIPCDINWKPDWKSFYEACDMGTPIEPVCEVFRQLHLKFPEDTVDIQIWSGRCESVRQKTLAWLDDNLFGHNLTWWDSVLKMRPIGDNTPIEELKERWLDEALEQGEIIDFIFDSCPKSIAMWRRRGIFVFDVNQSGKRGI